MKGRVCWFMLALHIFSWVSASTRLFPPSNDAISHTGPEEAPHSSFSYTIKSKRGMRETVEEEEYERRGVGKVGSSPPRCEHKCHGCTPCEAIQVPSKSHLGIMYANYEPESWKCKCGPSFYSP